MRYLGIDFGLKHLGLAIADGPLAEPFGEKKYEKETEALNFLSHICTEQAIEIVVIGLPEGRLVDTVRNFADQLNQLTNLKIIFQDETLSTQQAKAKLIAAHAPQKKRRFDHSAAAALILQDYLDIIN
ncbi:MAG: Holliday junction resolvase RuvX [Patescibacteria group bacterium]|nr:Holliday junction resolvase RuvX [Patescibacteria group bacterium]